MQNEDVQRVIKRSLHVQYKKFNFTKHEISMMGTKEVQPYPAGKFNAGVRRKCNLIEQESSMLGKMLLVPCLHKYKEDTPNK